MNTPLIRSTRLRPGRRTAALLIGLALAGSAMAQWQWRDASGSRVFSDTPPPPGVPESQILKRPAGVAAPAPTAAAAPAAASAAPAARPDDLEGKVRQAEEQKRKAEEQRVAKLKAEKCQRAQQRKATLESTPRLTRINAQGEREFLDEKDLAEETRRNQQDIAENCG